MDTTYRTGHSWGTPSDAMDSRFDDAFQSEEPPPAYHGGVPDEELWGTHDVSPQAFGDADDDLMHDEELRMGTPQPKPPPVRVQPIAPQKVVVHLGEFMKQKSPYMTTMEDLVVGTTETPPAENSSRDMTLPMRIQEVAEKEEEEARNRAMAIAAASAEEERHRAVTEERQRALRQRQRYASAETSKRRGADRRFRWRTRLMRWAKSWLPRDLTTPRIESHTNKWPIVEYIDTVATWYRGPGKRIVVTFTVLFLLWVFCPWIPPILAFFAGQWSSSTSALYGMGPIPAAARVRTDRAGIVMLNPMALAVLTPSMAVRTREFTEAARHVTDRIAKAATSADSRIHSSPESTAGGSALGESGSFAMDYQDPHQTIDWKQMVRDGSVKPPPSSGPSDSVVQWLRAECDKSRNARGRPDGMRARDAFMAAARGPGYLTVDIGSNHPDADDGQGTGGGVHDEMGGASVSVLSSHRGPQGMMITGNNNNNNKGGSGRPFPLLAAPPKTLRNVSIYELYEHMLYWASLAKLHSIERFSPSDPWLRAAESVTESAYRFDPLDPSGGARRAKGSGVIEARCREEALRMEEAKDAAVHRLRRAYLWSGASGCVCPHHLGVPVPGAAWFDPKSNAARVMFYTKVDQTYRGPVGTILRALVGATPDSPDSQQAATTMPGDPHSVAWSNVDPVLGPSHSDMDSMAIPTGKPGMWIEGIDHRGLRSRAWADRVGVACVMSCAQACG